MDEAEELVGKVKEKKMAELFADMDKMDIQAEREKTAEQRDRAEKAEERAGKAEAIAEKGILLFVETCKELDIPMETALKRLAEKCEIADSEAEAWISKYWEE